jgi:predicted nucleic acid-binding protein
MTTYVLDSSVAFKWVVPELHTDKALLLRDDFRNGVIQLLAPDFFPLELLHALTKAERQKRINPAEASTFWLDIMTTCPILSPSLPLAAHACAIATKARIGTYDCIYVALAEQEKCELVTADDRLVKNLQAQYPFIRPLASFP